MKSALSSSNCGINHSFFLSRQDVPSNLSLQRKMFRTTSCWIWHRKCSVSENPRYAELQRVGLQFPICVHWPVHLSMKRSFVAENKLFSETDRILIKRICHRVDCGIARSSGHRRGCVEKSPSSAPLCPPKGPDVLDVLRQTRIFLGFVVPCIFKYTKKHPTRCNNQS
jgi:hypothetical protein